MCFWDMWVVQWYCIFEALVEMCEVVGVELYVTWGCLCWMLVIESNSVNSGTEVLIENICIK